MSTITFDYECHTGHISFVTPDKLWVRRYNRLELVDTTGNVTKTLDLFPDWYDGNDDDIDSGRHTVSVEGDLFFISEYSYTEESDFNAEIDYKLKQMTSDGNITTILSFDLKPVSIHSSHINGDLLVGVIDDQYAWPPTAARVMQLDKTGATIKNIEFGKEGSRLYVYPSYITENKINGDIVVSDSMKKALVVVDRSGGHRFDYTGHSTFSSFVPGCVCTDLLGRILFIYSKMEMDNPSASCVSLLDQDGHFLAWFLEKPSNNTNIFKSISVDDKNNIYIAMEKEICVFSSET